jgi:hypothetical protein
MQPYFTVDHKDHDDHRFSDRIGKKDLQGCREYANHKVSIDSFCLVSFHVDFSLDDMYICQLQI